MLILANYYCEFKIDEKTFHEGYLQQFPSGMGLSGLTSQTGESVYNERTAGAGIRAQLRRLVEVHRAGAILFVHSVLATVAGDRVRRWEPLRRLLRL